MLKEKQFYIIVESKKDNRKQIIMWVEKRGIVSLDYLFDEAVELGSEYLLTPEGDTEDNFYLFLKMFLEKKGFEKAYILDLDIYNKEIQKINHASHIYTLFENKGLLYPDKSKERSLREKFLKI